MGSVSLLVRPESSAIKRRKIKLAIEACEAADIDVPEQLYDELDRSHDEPLKLSLEHADQTESQDTYRLYLKDIPKGSKFVLISLCY